MVVWVFVGLGILTYAVNIWLYFFFKKRPHRDWFERLSTYFGVNMTLLMTDGVFMLVAKVLEDALLVVE